MKPLSAAAFLSLLTCSAATTSLSPASTVGFTPLPLLGPANADKSSDLIAKFENPDERGLALEEIKGLGKKTPGKVKTYLMKQVGAADEQTARDAMDAVVSIGKPMTRSLTTALETGEYKGVPISASVAARIALRIMPTGERVIVPYLEEHPLTADVAAEIGEFAEPAAALQILVSKGNDDLSRLVTLEALRRLRDRSAFHGVEGASDLVMKAAEDFGAPTPQLLHDAAIDIDPQEDLERMRTWLTSGEPALSESALWSMGGVGAPLMELAPLTVPHLTSDSPVLREAAHWALRRLAVEDAAAAAVDETLEEGSLEPSAGVLEQLRLFRGLEAAKGGAVDAEAIESGAIECWKFAPRWIGALGDTLADSTFATETPGWQQSYVPPAMEEVMPTLFAALASEDQALSTPAGVTLIEWNVHSREMLLWAISAVGSEANVPYLPPVWSLLARESENGFLRQKLVANAFADALKKEATEVPTIKLLMRMDGPMTRKVLVDHFAGSPPSHPWDAQHDMASYHLMGLYPAVRPKLMPVIRERFLAGDTLAAPLLVVLGASADPILEEGLRSELLDVRMVALSLIMARGGSAQSMLPLIEALKEEDPAAQQLREEAIKAIS